MIEVKDLSFAYGRQMVLNNVNLTLQNGEVTALIGPNGAGKSTLLRMMARILKPKHGTVLVDGKNADAYAARAFARQLAFLPQSRPVPALSVQSVVSLGRFAHEKDDGAVKRALDLAGIARLAQRDMRSLSGGQRQMAFLAMMMAQESPNVLLDEPFTHLDIGAQLDVAHLIRRMAEEGKCVTVVMHDLNMLERVCGRAVLLEEGKVVCDGSADRCLRSAELQKAFGVMVSEEKGITFHRG